MTGTPNYARQIEAAMEPILDCLVGSLTSRDVNGAQAIEIASLLGRKRGRRRLNFRPWTKEVFNLLKSLDFVA